MLRLPRRNGSRSDTPVNGPHLTPDELQDFHRRYAALEAAIGNLTMVDESWRSWCSMIGAKYGVGTFFEVDGATGALAAKERPTPEARA